MPALLNRAVLVTGASTGIGRACVLDLAGRGALVFAGVRDATVGSVLASQAPDRIVPLLLDVTDPAQVAAAATAVGAATGDNGLFALVNNAGIAVAGPLEVLPDAALREQFEVNTFGPLALTQACLPLLRRARGRIVNVTSVNGRIVTPFTGAYAASKFALEAMSDALRRELAPTGVTVIVVQPGSIRTPIWTRSRERARRLAEQLPPASHGLYASVLARIKQVEVPARALPPEAVAVVVSRALTSARPRTRYRVGWDARLGVLLAHILPGRALDWLLGGRHRRRHGSGAGVGRSIPRT